MPLFIHIGPHNKNLCGNTSKGYFISINGKIVTVKFGSINCFKRKYYWAGNKLPMIPKPRKFKTEEEAIRLYNDRVRRRLKEGYRKLRSNTKIHPFKKLK